MRSVVVQGPRAIVNGKNVLHLCSNDYLGLAIDPRVNRKAIDALDEVSQCSSRLIAGNHPLIAELESKLAAHRHSEAALVFPTGYMANLGAVTALADKNSTILSDELNHASLIDACTLSGAKVKVFRHNDINHLESSIRKVSGRKIVITEGIFSVDGDLSDLRHICSIARANGALTILDDAHGDFIFGPDFSGVSSLLKANVDIHVSSLSKGLGCFGGYVASSARTIDLLTNTSKQFIYTSALPHHICAAAIEAIRIAKRGNLQSKLFSNIAYLRKKLTDFGFSIGESASQIMPIMIGREDLALEFSKDLLAAGVFAQAVRYPTVKKGSARLRLSVTAAHTKNQLDEALVGLQSVGRKKHLIT